MHVLLRQAAVIAKHGMQIRFDTGRHSVKFLEDLYDLSTCMFRGKYSIAPTLMQVCVTLSVNLLGLWPHKELRHMNVGRPLCPHISRLVLLMLLFLRGLAGSHARCWFNFGPLEFLLQLSSLCGQLDTDIICQPSMCEVQNADRLLTNAWRLWTILIACKMLFAYMG